MTANIIHHIPRFERLPILEAELKSQNITDFKIWDTIYANTIIKSINLSHKQIVQEAKDKELSKVLIFEDDIKFLGNGAFEYYLQNEPSDYDIYLGGIYLGQNINGLVERFTAMHCYIVNERFYDTFLNTDVNLHIDHSLAGLGKYVVCQPMIAVQHNGYSDNSKQYCNYDLLIQGKNLYSCQKINH